MRHFTSIGFWKSDCEKLICPRELHVGVAIVRCGWFLWFVQESTTVDRSGPVKVVYEVLEGILVRFFNSILDFIELDVCDAPFSQAVTASLEDQEQS